MNRIVRPDGSGRDGYIRASQRDIRTECQPTKSKKPANPLPRNGWQNILREGPSQTNYFVKSRQNKQAASTTTINPITGKRITATAVRTGERLERLARPTSFHSAAKTARARVGEQSFSISEFIGEGPEYNFLAYIITNFYF